MTCKWSCSSLTSLEQTDVLEGAEFPVRLKHIQHPQGLERTSARSATCKLSRVAKICKMRVWKSPTLPKINIQWLISLTESWAIHLAPYRRILYGIYFQHLRSEHSSISAIFASGRRSRSKPLLVLARFRSPLSEALCTIIYCSAPGEVFPGKVCG
jgi:hypothetical protein